MDRGQHGHPDWSVAVQPHNQQTVVLCVSLQLSIKTNVNSSVGSHHHGPVPGLPGFLP